MRGTGTIGKHLAMPVVIAERITGTGQSASRIRFRKARKESPRIEDCDTQCSIANGNCVSAGCGSGSGKWLMVRGRCGLHLVRSGLAGLVGAATAGMNNGTGEAGGIAKLAGTGNDLVGSLALYEGLRNDLARTRHSGLGKRGYGHVRRCPFFVPTTSSDKMQSGVSPSDPGLAAIHSRHFAPASGTKRKIHIIILATFEVLDNMYVHLQRQMFKVSL
jgi:hypothetical protein